MAYRELPSNKHVDLYNQQGHCERAKSMEREKEKEKQEKKLQIDSAKRSWLRFRRCHLAGEHVTLAVDTLQPYDTQ